MMNRIHKKTMTDEEREENRRMLDALFDRRMELDPENGRDAREIERIRKEESDLGDAEASGSLADSIEDGPLAEEYRKRTIFQLKVEYDRENGDREEIARKLYDLLKRTNRREEAVMWFVRALRYGAFVYANGDKKLLRDMLDVKCADREDLDDRFDMRSMDYLMTAFDDLDDEIESLNREIEKEWEAEPDARERDPGGDGQDDGPAGEEIDYCGGCVASASGGAPDFRDNCSGRRFRLPDDHPVPAAVLNTDAVGGGWGYAMRDAAVVQGGIPAERAFVEARVGEELRRMEKIAGTKFVFPDYQKYAHELVCKGNDFYDLLYVQVALIPEADWDRLKADWESHGGYENDEEGCRKHEEWRESRTIRFTEHFWFNVNAMFDFDDEED